MKTWISVGPDDKEMNRLEAEVGVIYPNMLAIKNSACTFSGVKSFSSTYPYYMGHMQLDTLQSDCTVESVLLSDIKNMPVNCPGFVFSNSVATENARRITQITADGTTPQPLTADNIVHAQGYRVPTGLSINFDSLYSGNNLIVILESATVGYNVVGEVHWQNHTASTSGAYGYNVLVPAGQTNKEYKNIGIGNITVTVYFTGTGFQNSPYVILRRCKHPLVEGEPIKRYSSDYITLSPGIITSSDITNFTVG